MSPSMTRFYQALGVGIFLGLWAIVAVITGASLIVAGVGTGVGILGFFYVFIMVTQYMNRDEAMRREVPDAALQAVSIQSRSARIVVAAVFSVLAIVGLIEGLWWVSATALAMLALAVLVWGHPLVRGRT